MRREKQAGVYAIIQKSTNRRYIGSTADLAKRECDHFRNLKLNKHCNAKLQAAWNKYGADDFYWFVIVYNEDAHELLNLEQAWIDFYQTTKRKHGFNISIFAGAPQRGIQHTPEARAKISAAGRRPCSEETRAKISAANKGRTRSPEQRAHLSKINTGKKLSPEVAEKLRQSLIGRKKTPEAIAKFSATRKGHIVTEETRAKISASKKGQKPSEEAKANMSKGQTGHRAYTWRVTPEQVYIIRGRLAQGETLKSISNDFGIAISTVSNIKTGYTWPNVVYP
jgi:group I intron endonuclease